METLFVEVVKIELSNYKKLSENIIMNTIKHFAEMVPFNKISIDKWSSICLLNGIQSKI